MNPSRRSFLALAASMAALRKARALSFVTAPAVQTIGTIYYVSTSGSDSNNGTSPSTPWQTITHVNSQTFHQGDRILFNGGQNFSGSIALTTTNYIAQPSSVTAYPLTIGSYGTGNATISPTSADGVIMTDVNNVAVQNLTITGDNSQNYNGINIVQTGSNGPVCNISLSGLAISNFGRAGIIGTSANTANSVNNIQIYNCSVSGCTGNINITGQVTAGIVFGTAQSLGTRSQSGGTFTSTLAFNSVRVDTCTVENCPGTASPGSVYQSSTGILYYNTADGLVQYCFVSGNGTNETQGNAGIELNWNTNSIIQFNEVYNQISSSAPGDGDAFDLDTGCINCIVQYNYGHHCGGSGISLFNFSPFTNSGNVVRFNILENNAQSHSNYPEIFVNSFNSGSMPTTFQIYNNTVYNNVNTGTYNLVGVYISGGTGNGSGTFANNIIYSGNASNVLGVNFGNVSSFTTNGNWYYSASTYSWNWNGTTNTSFSGYKTTSGQETNSTSGADPKLTNPGSGGTVGGYNPPNPTAYELQSSSTARGAGLNLSTSYSINPGLQDFYGNTIPNGIGTGYNAGAYGN